MKTIRVVAAVIRDGDRIFATERGYGEFKGWWEFPGGKIEEGETPQQALEREIREELTAKIKVGEKITTVEYDYPEFHLSMDCFWAKVEWGVLELKEAEDAKWLRRDRLDSVKWLPADLELIGLIREELKKHGPLVEFGYNLSTHGMMAGTGSSRGSLLKWKPDGSVILRISHFNSRGQTISEYSVKPETAEKVREYVADSRLADLADEKFDQVMMADNFTSASISMIFDDHELGGYSYQSVPFFLGPSGYTFAPIEKKVSALLEECRKDAELLKTEGNLPGNENAVPGLMFTADTPAVSGLLGSVPIYGRPAALGNPMMTGNTEMPVTEKNTESSATPAIPGTWNCTLCGKTGNTGNFCPECGNRKN